MEELNIARFPRPVYGRIPNFVGSEEAAKRLVSIERFQNSRVIKVNPDSPQRPVRRLLLEKRKSLLMPTPRLKNGLLLLLSSNILDKDLSYASSIRGSFKYGNKARLNELPRVDGVVVGSVSVSITGARVGKGRGYSDLEYAILREFYLVNDSVPIATTVHEVQIINDVPIERHDVPVDYIVTPKRVIETKTTHPKPKGIMWNKITNKMLDEMPILTKLVKKGKLDS
jgi:5-formyltetrahydrofolate cyclo-ligase